MLKVSQFDWNICLCQTFIVNINKRLKPFFLEQHINIVNRVTLQSFSFIFSVAYNCDDNAILQSIVHFPDTFKDRMEPVFYQALKAGHVGFVTDTYIQCTSSSL